MICIDAISLDFVRAHLDRLPVFRALLREGTLATMSSPAGLLSACAWPSFATGDDPGAHGHYFPFQWDPANMRFERTSSPAMAAALDFEPFWRRLARRGVKTVAFDTALSLDAAKAPCVEITNWSYQSSGLATASDPALLREIRRRFGRRPIGKEVPVPKTLRHSRRIRDDLIEALRRKTDATLWLMDRLDWRLFVAGFYELHRAGHNLLVVDGDFGSEADPDALLEVYEAQDRELGRLVSRLKEKGADLVLFSLHGMAANRVQDHFLDEILSRLNEKYRVERGAAPRKRKSNNLVTALRARIPHRLQFSLAYLLGEHVQDFIVNRSFVGGVDWKTTPSFRLASGGEGYIRLNMKGRERDGYFGAEEAERYRRWLSARLAEIRVAATDEPLIGEIVDLHAVFPGERTDALPDIVLTFAPSAPARAVTSPAIGTIEAHLDTGRGGNHTGDAFAIGLGAAALRLAEEDIGDIKDLGRVAEALLFRPAPMRATVHA